MKKENNKSKKSKAKKMEFDKIPRPVMEAIANIVVAAAEVIEDCQFDENADGTAARVSHIDLNTQRLCDLYNSIHEANKLEDLMK